MSATGPILLIEDDPHDLDVLISAFRENKVTNEIKSFIKAKDALDYLYATKDLPFIIICDIRIPGMNGLEFRKAINEDEFLRRKSIPFLFYTVAVSQQIINTAYDLTVQGFFEKPANFHDLKKQLDCITSYWSSCLHPNNLGRKYL